MSESATTTRPQPIGAFGMPAGLLLLPDDEARSAACELLVQGKLPRPWPESLAGHREVYEGADLTSAQVQQLFAGDDPICAYNRWVLDPESGNEAAVRAGLPAELAPLVDVVSYSMGTHSSVGDQEAAAPEVRALLLATAATHALARGEVLRAPELLLRGAELVRGRSDALAAVLQGNAGTLLQEQGDLDAATEHLTAALTALAGTDLRDVRAELLYRLGSIAQERAADGDGDERDLLQEAMTHYYDGLQLVTADDSPYLWASLNMNLATAHLSVPMTQASDQLRLGVAAQSLRAARRIFTAQEHPQQWSSATLNLANALVYTPSTHQADNLVEAVELYEEVLASGVREENSLGRARVLAGQGNVLAHLGAFEAARPKLVEARFIFEEHLDHDGALTVRGILDEIAKTQVSAPGEQAGELDRLAHAAEQMSRMPHNDGAFTSGMGVTITPAAGLDATTPPKPKVTVVDAATRPTPVPKQEQP